MSPVENTLTITAALSEIKMLDLRINKKIRTGVFVGIKVGEKSTSNFKAQSDWDSIKALVDRRSEIKALIMASNAVTKVTVNKDEMTIAEAIEKKDSIRYLLDLSEALKYQKTNADQKIETLNLKAQTRLDKILEASASSDNDSEALKELTESFNAMNNAKLDDQIDIQSKIEALDENISGFESEVDIALSISNATTMITLTTK